VQRLSRASSKRKAALRGVAEELDAFSKARSWSSTPQQRRSPHWMRAGLARRGARSATSARCWTLYALDAKLLPGQRHNLDAICKRLRIDKLDVENCTGALTPMSAILAEVILAMRRTGALLTETAGMQASSGRRSRCARSCRPSEPLSYSLRLRLNWRRIRRCLRIPSRGQRRTLFVAGRGK